MGEYAKYRGESIKIGTCESMYYLRADQRHLISGYDFDESLRYRFPFPDEDHLEPGIFDDHDRGVRIPGYAIPSDYEGHGSVQFTSSAGYVLSIPCPEQFDTPGLGPVDVGGVNVHRNGFHGHAVVKQQRQIDGQLLTVISCGACGSAWRLPDLESAMPIVDAFRDEADRQEYRRDLNGWGNANSDKERAFLMEMAVRIIAGYLVATATEGR